MSWPSTLSSFTNPLPTNRLNNPSHSSIETAQNTGLSEVQKYVGVLNGTTASALGTLIGDVKNPASDGGGHIQSAVKGGTGQTSYTKGNLLVATDPTTLSKLAVGGDSQVLVANSQAAAGVQWGSVVGVPTSVATVIPYAPLANQYLEFRVNTSVTATVGRVVITSPISASTVTFRVNEATNAGTGDFTLYNESGSASVFTVTTNTINAVGNKTTSLGPKVFIPQGNYYAMYNNNGDTNVLLATWGILRGNPSALTLGGISGKGNFDGTLTIAGGTPPASITLSAISSVGGSGNTPVFRIDN